MTHFLSLHPFYPSFHYLLGHFSFFFLPSYVSLAAMVTSRPEMFKPSTIDEGEILKLVEDHLLPPRALLQWRPAKGKDIPTPNTQEIVVWKSFFQRGFGIPNRDFFHGFLDYFKFELVHLNSSSILQITIFVHLWVKDFRLRIGRFNAPTCLRESDLPSRSDHLFEGDKLN
jgi:hypothetical protein